MDVMPIVAAIEEGAPAFILMVAMIVVVFVAMLISMAR